MTVFMYRSDASWLSLDVSDQLGVHDHGCVMTPYMQDDFVRHKALHPTRGTFVGRLP